MTQENTAGRWAAGSTFASQCRRRIQTVLSLFVLMLLLPLGALAADEAWVEYNSSTKTLTFKYGEKPASFASGISTYAMNAGDNDPDWTTKCVSTTKVVIDSSFDAYRPTSCYYWFSLAKLESIEGLQYLHTDAVTTMKGMFSSCKLSQIDLSAMNTENVENMAEMFQSCKNLTSLSLSTFNTAKVTDMSAMFSGCTSLTKLDLTSFNTENVEDMSAMFKQSTGLTSVELSSFSTAKVKAMDYMFYKCTALQTISVSEDFVTSAVTNSKYMFTDCSALAGAASYDDTKVDASMATWTSGYLTLKDGQPLAVFDSTTGTLTFKYGTKATYTGSQTAYDLNSGSDSPGWADVDDEDESVNKLTKKVVFDQTFDRVRPTSCYEWFGYMEKLASIEGLQYLHTDSVTNMGDMFNNCRALTSLDLSTFNTEQVTDMRYMFKSCKARTINLSSFNTEKVTTMYRMFYDCDADTLDLTSFRTQSVTNMVEMFSSCDSLKSLKLTNFNTAQVTTMEEMFSGCKILPALDLSMFNTENVTTMVNMFRNCAALTSLNLASFNTAQVKDMDNMFNGCASLTSLSLTSFNTEKVEDMSDMFKGCAALTSLDLTSFNTAQVTDMNNMFNGCAALTSLNLTSFNTAQVTDMNNMFNGCAALTSLNLASFNTEKVEDMSSMFYGCTDLKTIYVDDAFVTGAVSDGDEMFSECTSLEGAKPYDENATGADMASYTTGYFSVVLKPWVELDSTAQTLTFKYGKKPASAASNVTIYDLDLNNIGSVPAWTRNSAVTKAVVDSSFVDARPTSCLGWFYALPNLTTIEGLENLCTDSVTNMAGMFCASTSLTTLDLSIFNTEKVQDAAVMFAGCSALKTIYTSSQFSLPSTAETTRMFDGTSNLVGAVKYDEEKVDGAMANFATGYFTLTPKATPYAEIDSTARTLTFKRDIKPTSASAGKAVYDLNVENYDPGWVGNTAVTTVVFDPTFDAVRPTSCYDWFYGMSNVAEIRGIEYLHTDSVTTMYRMFANCKNLYNLDLARFNTEQVTNMAGMFTNCSNIFYLSLTSFNTEKVDVMTGMFSGCNNLQRIFVSDAFVTSGISDVFSGALMFTYCSSLYGAVSFDPNSTSYTMANATSGYFTIPQNIACADVDVRTGTLTFKYGLESDLVLSASATFQPLNTGTDDPFYLSMYSQDITKVVFDPSFDAARPTSCYHWFAGLENLTTIEGIEYLHTDSVTNMTGMFFTCLSLDTIDLSRFNTAKVTDMSEMFVGCSRLNTLDLSSFCTDSVTNMSAMFSDCSALTSLNLSSFNTEQVTEMKEMFFGCTSLPTLNLSSFNTENVTEMIAMFYQCTNLKTIYVSDRFVISALSDSTYDVFTDCPNLVGAVPYDENKLYASMANWTTGYLTLLAKAPWVEFDSTAQTLTFKYGKKPASAASNVTIYDLDLNNIGSVPAWTRNSAVTKAVVDSSFVDARPTSCLGWFYALPNLTTIEGLENLCTDSVTNMAGMFCASTSLTTLDLSIFNTEKVQDAAVMFAGCSALKTIYTSSQFSLPSTAETTRMFDGTSNLVGAVKYDEEKVDGTMANFTTGYFTLTPKATPYVELDSTARTLTFKRDIKPTAAQVGKAVFSLNEDGKSPKWHSSSLVTTVVFDPSFAAARPTTCQDWFLDLNKLKKVEGIEHLCTDSVTSMKRMFQNCMLLDSLNLSGFNTENVTNMYRMFYNCASLTSLNISSFRTKNVTDMSGMFLATALKSLDLSSFSTENVTDMSQMFSGCTSLTDLTLTSFDTKNVEDMKEMFNSCSSLTTIYASDLFVTSALTDPNYSMFFGCANLEGAAPFDEDAIDATMANTTTGYFTSLQPKAYVELDTLSWTLTFKYAPFTKAPSGTICYDLNQGDEYPAYAYDYYKDYNDQLCFKIQKAVFDPSFAKVRPISCCGWFYGCISLAELEGIENLCTDSVTNMAVMFNGCYSLDSVDLSGFNTENVTTMNYMFASTNFANLDLSSFNTKNVEQMYGMFESCGYDTLDLSSFNTENVTDMSGMFYQCKYLTSVNLSSFRTDNVKDMSKMFSECYSLSDLDLSSFRTDSVQSMYDMFNACSSLTSLDLTKFNTQNVEYMAWMFAGCSSLTSLNLSSFTTDKVTSMANIFYGCRALTQLNLSSFNTESATSMYGMFRECESLTELDLTSFNTNKVTNTDEMFRGCSQLQTIYASDEFTTDSVTTSNEMFLSCTNLEGAASFNAEQIEVAMANYNDGYFKSYYQVGDDRTELFGTTLNVSSLELVDGEDFVSYAPFSADLASYSRQMTRKWGTLCLPFAINADDNTTCAFYDVQMVEQDELVLTKLTGSVDAGTPVVVCRTTTASQISIAAQNVDVVRRPVDAAVGDWTLHGTFTQADVPDGCYFIAKDKFWLVDNVTDPNKGQAAGVKVKGLRAWLKPTVSTVGQGQWLNIYTPDAATSISSALDDLNAPDAEYYDANGRRIPQLQKGINIVKVGETTRKVLVK